MIYAYTNNTGKRITVDTYGRNENGTVTEAPPHYEVGYLGNTAMFGRFENLADAEAAQAQWSDAATENIFIHCSSGEIISWIQPTGV